ncbi:gamma-glutamylcyclotransferase [Bacillus sp. H-16]|uniref:gamma-glutamylcyclotransferase n=1 Tax=Alteribacter salitolerans TaxID=2912333 RepID=UPI0019632E23|nr:gamma-glutamylcyclotransferase [Alteribacter salitolerans]MBM7094536.1 gamma-glutamylcyclotransferase [Alteribacter salitolerans]
MNERLLFVYGTLRKGALNAHYLDNVNCVHEQSWIEGTLFDTGSGYPAFVQRGNGRVYGELYEIPDRLWADIHYLEGYDGSEGSLFKPVTVSVTTDTVQKEAVVYVSGRESLLKTEIPEGDWMRLLFERGLGDSFLYFAFGSCMDKERMELAGADQYFHEITGASLPGYELRFTIASRVDGKGRADIVEEGGLSEGLLYRTDKEGLDYLYKREGVFTGMYRPAIISVQGLDGNNYTDVLTFLVIDKQSETAPPDHYANEILRGAAGWLTEGYIDKLKNRIHQLQVSEKNQEV